MRATVAHENYNVVIAQRYVRPENSLPADIHFGAVIEVIFAVANDYYLRIIEFDNFGRLVVDVKKGDKIAVKVE